MPRRARLSVPGIPWHIIQRGNNRSVCFHAEEDYNQRVTPYHLSQGIDLADERETLGMPYGLNRQINV